MKMLFFTPLLICFSSQRLFVCTPLCSFRLKRGFILHDIDEEIFCRCWLSYFWFVVNFLEHSTNFRWSYPSNSFLIPCLIICLAHCNLWQKAWLFEWNMQLVQEDFILAFWSGYLTLTAAARAGNVSSSMTWSVVFPHPGWHIAFKYPPARCKNDIGKTGQNRTL